MDPVTAYLAMQLKRRLLRTLVRWTAALLPLVLVAWLALTVFAASLVAGSSSSQAGTLNACTTVNRPAGADVGSLDPEQIANAQTIIAVGRQLHVPQQGWVIALATAMQESTLHNLPYGDRDSIGLFQQRNAWGSRADRLNPVTAATMFYTGGHGGQRGLLQVPNYLTLPVTVAAQAVQASAFPDAYARWEPLARQLAGSPTIAAATCGDGVIDGSVGARVVAAAEGQLGVPYSWGGGNLDGPSLGIGPGAHTVGFDCSSLVRYAWYQATGIILPRGATDQAAAVTPVRLDQVQPGDLIFFHAAGDPPGFYHHVGIYAGDGQMIQAPSTGRLVSMTTASLQQGTAGGGTVLAGRP